MGVSRVSAAKSFFKKRPPRVGPAHMHLSQKTTSHGWVPPTSSSLRANIIQEIIGSVNKFIFAVALASYAIISYIKLTNKRNTE